MIWYVQLIIYLISIFVSFLAMWQVDFNKFIRVGKKEMAIFVYVIISLALGFLVGKLFIEIGTIFQGFTK